MLHAKGHIVPLSSGTKVQHFLAEDKLCREAYIICNARASKHSNLIGNATGNGNWQEQIVMVRVAKEDMWERSLTVKETMLETRVDKAEGMNVSCLGIGLMRRPTFCRAHSSALS